MARFENTPVTDLLVVGAGVAGLSAALEAAAMGLEVVVVDAEATYGGASAISGGGCLLVGTPVQAALGIEDSVQLALSDWSACGGPTADLIWAKHYLEHSTGDVYDWCESLGITWAQDLVSHVGNSVPRFHKPIGSGARIVAAICGRLRQLPIGWQLDTRVVHLEPGGGRILATLSASRGQRGTIEARAVLVATGGFASNLSMLRAQPRLARLDNLLCGSSYTSDGSGLALLEEFGAQIVNLDEVWIYPIGTPNYRFPGMSRGLAVRGIYDEIWVNRDGRRFHDENNRGGVAGSAALLDQPGATAWGIFDSREAEHLLLLDDGYFGTSEYIAPHRREEFFSHSPFVWRSDSIAGLAEKVGIPVAPLEDAVSEFNQAIRLGQEVDPATGRDLRDARPIQSPPFYGIQYQPLAQKTFGGVRTDLGCRVLSTAGAPIPGLYAAGEVAGMAGGHINGTAALEGTMFGPCLFSGRVAGITAAADHRGRFSTG